MTRRLLDIVGASALLVLSLPIFLTAVVAALVSHGRPIFFGHWRVGREGSLFVCWKLRTMHVSAERELEADETLNRLHRESGYKLPTSSDPRVTPVGRWLRRWYLDELPQLFNVLRGDLALVGPRPIVVEELDEFGEDAPELLSVRPGIFGAWVCLGPGRPPYPERAAVELRYVRERTLLTDAMILARSLGTVLRGEPPPTDVPRSLDDGRSGTLGRTLSNANALLFAYLLPRGFSFLSVVVAARTLGTTEFGAYGTAAAYAVILSIVATLGMTPLLIRDIARDPGRAPQLMRAAHVVKTGANVLMLLMLVGIARLVGYERQIVAAAVILGFGYAIGAYAENLSAYYQAHERMYVWTQASALFGFVSGIGGIAILLATGDLVLFCVSPALGWVAALTWLLARAPAQVRWGASVEARDLQALVRALAPFAAGFALMVVYYKVDVLLLAEWRSADEVGVYSASYRLVDIFQALVVVASGAVYPRLSRQAVEHGAAGPTAGGRSTEILLLAALPVAGTSYFLADPLIGFLYGPSYADGAAILTILALVLPPLAVTIHGGYVLAAAGHMGTVAALYVGGLGVNLTMNALLIPAQGGAGAATAMLVSEGTLAVAFLWALNRLVGSSPGRSAILAVALGLGGGWLVSGLAQPAGAYVAAAAFVAMLAMVYALTGAFGAGELRALATVLRPGRRVQASP